jgi:hypothetical protein
MTLREIQTVTEKWTESEWTEHTMLLQMIGDNSERKDHSLVRVEVYPVDGEWYGYSIIWNHEELSNQKFRP